MSTRSGGDRLSLRRGDRASPPPTTCCAAGSLGLPDHPWGHHIVQVTEAMKPAIGTLSHVLVGMVPGFTPSIVSAWSPERNRNSPFRLGREAHRRKTAR